MRRHVRAAASLSFLAAQARKLSLTVAWVGGGTSNIPRAEQRRRCSYRSLERILCVLGRSLGSRAICAIELVEKLGLRPL